MAELVTAATGAPVELIEGAGGVFDLRVDGRLAWSKARTGRFPRADDLTRALAPPPAP